MPGLLHLSPAFIEGIGGPELLMIMFVILLLFGADRLPDLARGFGRAIAPPRRHRRPGRRAQALHAPEPGLPATDGGVISEISRKGSRG
jgi:TatA/E family protein of Tat protein translocase